MSTRKVRADKGSKRKPLPTEREEWRNTFRAMDSSEQGFELGYLTAIRDSGNGIAAKPEPTVIAAALPLAETGE